MSSAELNSFQDKNLLTVKYTRAQKASPDFATVYESIDQSVDITISTVILRAAPEPVLAMYDFVMTTFVPKSEPPAINIIANQVVSANASESSPQNVGSSETIRVGVKLASVQSERHSSTMSFGCLTAVLSDPYQQ